MVRSWIVMVRWCTEPLSDCPISSRSDLSENSHCGLTGLVCHRCAMPSKPENGLSAQVVLCATGVPWPKNLRIAFLCKWSCVLSNLFVSLKLSCPNSLYESIKFLGVFTTYPKYKTRQKFFYSKSYPFCGGFWPVSDLELYCVDLCTCETKTRQTS